MSRRSSNVVDLESSGIVEIRCSVSNSCSSFSQLIKEKHSATEAITMSNGGPAFSFTNGFELVCRFAVDAVEGLVQGVVRCVVKVKRWRY